MRQISQKDAVYQATRAVLEKRGIEFQDGQDIREAIKDDLRVRSEIRDLVAMALSQGQVIFAGGRNRDHDIRNERDARAYATGLVSNWFRKDRRLNGGETYRPGSSRGGFGGRSQQGDPVSALEGALRVVKNDDLRQRIQEEIDEVRGTQGEDVGLVGQAGPDADFDENMPGAKETARRIFSGSGPGRGGSDEEEQLPPSFGSGHRGAVTDPEHDMRLKQNETPELREARQEAGHRGGTTVARERGSEFYSQIGQKGGLSRGSNSGNNRGGNDRTQAEEGGVEGENIFTQILQQKDQKKSA